MWSHGNLLLILAAALPAAWAEGSGSTREVRRHEVPSSNRVMRREAEGEVDHDALLARTDEDAEQTTSFYFTLPVTLPALASSDANGNSVTDYSTGICIGPNIVNQTDPSAVSTGTVSTDVTNMVMCNLPGSTSMKPGKYLCVGCPTCANVTTDPLSLTVLYTTCTYYSASLAEGGELQTVTQPVSFKQTTNRSTLTATSTTAVLLERASREEVLAERSGDDYPDNFEFGLSPNETFNPITSVGGSIISTCVYRYAGTSTTKLRRICGIPGNNAAIVSGRYLCFGNSTWGTKPRQPLYTKCILCGVDHTVSCATYYYKNFLSGTLAYTALVSVTSVWTLNTASASYTGPGAKSAKGYKYGALNKGENSDNKNWGW